MPTPPDPVAHFDIEFHPTPKVLRWRADYSANPQCAAITQLRLRVIDTASNAIITEQPVPAPANYDYTGQITLATLPPGRYEAELFLDTTTPASTPGKTMVFNYATNYPWLNNTIGISDQVIPPYTPITVTGNAVGTLLRNHTMTQTGLWGQVTALDQPLLNGPMRFEVTQHGRQQPIRGTLHFAVKTAARVVSEANWTAGALHGRTISDFDYDGCMKVTLKLQQQPGTTIDKMDLVIPVNNAIAPLYHENGDGLRYNMAGYIPQGDGVVWSSDQASKSAFVGTFIPYIWVGGEELGLCWFADTDKDWVVDCSASAAPSITLERKGNTLNLRVRLIQLPTTLTREHTIVFGLQATPTRLQPEQPTDWRSWGNGTSPTFNWGFAGMCDYYGCPYYSLAPLNDDYTIIQKVAEAKKTGVRDDAFFTAYINANPDWAGDINWASNPGNFNVVIPYTDILGDEEHNPEWPVYQDEWKINSFPDWNMFPGWGWEREADYPGPATSASNQPIDFVIIPTKSRRDYMLYMYQLFFQNGFDGIYWDNTYIYANNNPITSDAYTRPDGQVQPSGNIWEMRDLFKRTAVLQYQMGKPNCSMIHSTNSYIVPLASWVGYNLDWEWKYGPDDFQTRVARDYIRAATMGGQAGTIPTILDGVENTTSQAQYNWVERTRTAVLGVHELTSWMNDLPTTQYFWTLGYGTSDCLVYNYWDSNPVATFTGLDDEFLVLQNDKLGKVAIMISDFGNGGTGTVKLDTARLGLPANFVAINHETPSTQITAQNGAFTFTIQKHDYQIFEIDKQ